MHNVAIIAGTGTLPYEACAYFLKNNIPFFVITLFPSDNAQQLETLISPSAIVVKPFYKLGTIFNELKERDTSHVLFIGKVDKQHMLKNLRYDWLALKLLAKMAFRSDKQIMETLVNELAAHGIQTLSQAEVLEHLYLPAGFTQGTLTPEIERDIKMGMEVANSLSVHEIGQTVVVKDGMVLAVEAIEGTDACIRRGIKLGKKKIVICKGAHHNHNSKYDLPTLGPSTLELINEEEVAAIAWKASHTFIADQHSFLTIGAQKKIILAAL